jgi:uncharacterized repeat protein (TIGR02543 family)
MGIFLMLVGLFGAGGAFAVEVVKADLDLTALTAAIFAVDGKKESVVTPAQLTALKSAIAAISVTTGDAGTATPVAKRGTTELTGVWELTEGLYSVTVSFNGGDDYAQTSNLEVATFEILSDLDVRYTVTWNLGGGTGTWSGAYTGPANGVVTQANVASGSTVTALSPAPTRSGYTFVNWYTDAGTTKEANFSTYTVTANTTFYAKWSGVVVGGTTEVGKIYQYVGGSLDPTDAIGTIVAAPYNQTALYEPKTLRQIGAVDASINDVSKYGANANYKVVSIRYVNSALGTYEYTLSGTKYVPTVATETLLRGLGLDPSKVEKHGVVSVGEYAVTAVMEYVKAGTGVTAPDTVRTGTARPVTFNVLPRDLSKATMTITLTDREKVYDGSVKEPRISISDGTGNVLVESRDYDLVTHTTEEWTNAGTVTVVAKGKDGGNYSGETEKRGTFTITPAPLKFAETQAYVSDPFKKAYDGTTNVDTAMKKLDIKFVYTGNNVTVTGLALGDIEGYSVTNLKYNTATVGTDKTVTATVKLGTVGKAKNYSLANGSFSVSGQVIEKNVPTAAMFTATYGSPAKTLVADGTNRVLFTNSAKIVDVKWVTAVSSGAGKIIVKYNGETVAPKEIGSYEITADVTAGTNLDTLSGIALGTLSIESALPPEIDPATPADTSYYASSSVTLKVSAANPKDGKTNGLTYQWYEVGIPGVREDTLVLQRGATSASYTVKETIVGVHQYRVKVTYKDAEQDTASVWSRDASVTVFPAPKSIRGALIVASPAQGYIYSGTKVMPMAEDFSVSVDGQTLEPNRDYRVKSADNSTNAGDNTALVTIEGLNAYKDTEIGTFSIAKRVVALEDLQITYSVDYNGQAQEIRVAAKSGLNGLGTVTRVYTPDTASRNNAGTWDVVLSIAEGQNFEAVEALPLAQMYTIRKAVFSASMLNYANLPKEVAWTGENQGIAAPTLKGLGANSGGSVREGQ